jgi:hypothetical protein
MSKLTDAHIEQIKNMKEDGKKGPEIIQFFKDTYNIRLGASEISRAVHNKLSGVASDERLRRRAAQRKYIRKSSSPVNIVDNNDFAMHVHAAFNIHKKDFIPRIMEVLNKVE